MGKICPIMGKNLSDYEDRDRKKFTYGSFCPIVSSATGLTNNLVNRIIDTTNYFFLHKLKGISYINERFVRIEYGQSNQGFHLAQVHQNQKLVKHKGF